MREYLNREQLEEMAEEMVNETTDMVKIGTLEYEPGQVLKSVDPVAWREVVNEYADSLAEDDEYIIDGYHHWDDLTDEEQEEYYDVYFTPHGIENA